MNVYDRRNEQDIVKAVIETLETDTGKKIQAMRIVNESFEHLEVLVEFDDEKVLHGNIWITEIDGKMAFRVKGNYI